MLCGGSGSPVLGEMGVKVGTGVDVAADKVGMGVGSCGVEVGLAETTVSVAGSGGSVAATATIGVFSGLSVGDGVEVISAIGDSTGGTGSPKRDQTIPAATSTNSADRTPKIKGSARL